MTARTGWWTRFTFRLPLVPGKVVTSVLSRAGVGGVLICWEGSRVASSSVLVQVTDTITCSLHLRNITASCKPSLARSVNWRDEWIPGVIIPTCTCSRDRRDTVYSHHIVGDRLEPPATRTMTGTPSTSTLDHIVFLSPPGTLPETRKKFTEYGFE